MKRALFLFPRDLSTVALAVERVLTPLTPHEHGLAATGLPVWRVCLCLNEQKWFTSVARPMPFTLADALADLDSHPVRWAELIAVS